MGLFSKNTEAPAAPPMPPAPAGAPAPDMAPSMGAPMPPAPSMSPAPGMDMASPQAENSMSELSDGSNLTPPSLPGSGLDDIKSQVVGDQPQTQLPSDIGEKEQIDNESFSVPEVASDEDLFNMFKIEDDEISHSSQSAPVEQAHSAPVNTFEESTEESQSFMPETVETHLDNSTELAFENKKLSKADETIFLTTTQFKALLEVVDAVKTKIKSSTETHLKLMDMKAEEDVEYDTLRKDFQFIEDKLHDLDGILFDN